jgi:hypothetical protein
MIVSAALAFAVGVRAAQKRAVLDWLPFFGFLYGYDYTRGAADAFGFPVRVGQLYRLEQSLFGIGGQIPTVWLQRQLYHPAQVAWWEALVALMYCSHFVVPWLIVGVLYLRDRERWVGFAGRLLTMSFAALITYVLVPAAPPWYAARAGIGPEIARISTRGWSELHISIAGQLISLGQGVVNQVAAIPSLHAGTTFTIAMFFWQGARPWLRGLLVAYPAFMIFTLVYGGEHYLVDALLGAAYAVAVEIGWRWWQRRRLSPITAAQ